MLSGENKLLDVEDLSSNMVRLRDLFKLFDQKTNLMQLLDLSHRADGVQIFIGGESVSNRSMAAASSPPPTKWMARWSDPQASSARPGWRMAGHSDRRHHHPPALERALLQLTPTPANCNGVFGPNLPTRDDRATRGTGVLLVVLGTPGAPTAAALRPTCDSFCPTQGGGIPARPVWWLILNRDHPHHQAASGGEVRDGVGPTKARRSSSIPSARSKSSSGLSRRQGHDGIDGRVRDALRRTVDSGHAGAHTRRRLHQDPRRITLYPQYAASTTASVMDEVARCMLEWRNTARNPYVRDFAGDPDISALAASVREHWARNGEPEKLVMSFHGVPRFSLDKGDPTTANARRPAAAGRSL